MALNGFPPHHPVFSTHPPPKVDEGEVFTPIHLLLVPWEIEDSWVSWSSVVESSGPPRARIGPGGYQVKTPFVRPLRHKETKFPWFPNCVVYLFRVHYVIISDNPYLPAAVDGTLHFRGRWARTPRWQTTTCLVYGCPGTDDLTTHLCLKIFLLLELLL